MELKLVPWQEAYWQSESALSQLAGRFELHVRSGEGEESFLALATQVFVQLVVALPKLAVVVGSTGVEKVAAVLGQQKVWVQ